MNREFIEKLKTLNNIETDTHSGSYELVSQGVHLLSKLDLSVIDVSDLEMLFHFGNLKHGKAVRSMNIQESHLLENDKNILLLLNEKISAGNYTNSGLDDTHKSNGNCGLFSKGLQTLMVKSNKKTAQAFIKILIDISKIPDSDTNKIFEITSSCLSNKLNGLGVGIASQILHLLRPNVFPVLNSVGQEGYINKIGLLLYNVKDLKNYIDNVKLIKDFRDKELPTFNYRTIDVAMWNLSQEDKEPNPELHKVQKGISYWLGGATFGTGDVSSDFISSGVYSINFGKEDISKIASDKSKLDSWINNLQEPNAKNAFKLFSQIKSGDKIAIKSSYAKGTVSLLRIKAIGTILEDFVNGYQYNADLGHTIPVKWEAVIPNIDYKIGGYMKTIHKILKKEDIERIFYTENSIAPEPHLTKYPYTKKDFLDEVYMESSKYDEIKILLERKKNIIFQGAPGVGKSFLAKRLAYSIIGQKSTTQVEMVQFHQNYSYEDFVEGFRPISDGNFALRKGIFFKFCEKAKKDINNKYFFVIDEINRGNLSKIMGELMLLLENDKRGAEFAMPLTYSGDGFYVPENIYIIGMMNTADRSLAMMDYALRRRFSFVPIEPAFENKRFISDFKANYHDAEIIIGKMKKLNQLIATELDNGHKIGHSYFCGNKLFADYDIDGIFKYEIVELLREYFFDNEKKLDEAMKLL